MKYVKIRAASYNEAMMKLRMEHGDDAIPISHKFVKEGGIFNSKLFAKDVVELTAAVQEKKLKSSSPASGIDRKKFDVTVGDPARDAARPAVTKVQDIIDRAVASSNRDEFSRSLGRALGGEGAVPPAPAEPVRRAPAQVAAPARESVEPSGDEPVRRDDEPRAADGNAGRIERELEEIKQAITRITAGKGGSLEPGSDEDYYMKPFRDILKNNDYDHDQCNSMIGDVRNAVSRDDLKDRYKIEKSLRDLLKSRIVTTGAIRTGNKKKIIMFVGPTGVGKTTTMAKLGAINSLREGHSVSFITIDNYRIAATEQLKKYAEIMSIPIHVVANQKEFKDILAGDRAEIIMVDTSGRSHRNDLKISEIKSFAESVDYDFEKVLCVSANTKKGDLNEIFRAFDTLHFNSVIITKVDETSYIGNVIDIADKYKKPISYFTNGQEVPNDIVVADPDKIVDIMIGGYVN